MYTARVRHRGQDHAARVDGPLVELYDRDPNAAVLGGPVVDLAALTGVVVPLAEVELLVPSVPTKILGVGTNYRAHALEMGKPLPEEPLLFMKPPSALLAQGGTIVRPRGYARVDFEGELCVVIGRPTRNVDPHSALSHVYGYTICNDVTVRDLQKKDVQFTRAKGFDTFCPVGPVIRTDLDPRALRLSTRVNGVVRQDSSTADLIFSVAELVSFASRVMTLLPGDLITTGTPSGVGNLVAGDVVEIEIEGIGTLRNAVIDAPAPAP